MKERKEFCSGGLGIRIGDWIDNNTRILPQILVFARSIAMQESCSGG